LQIVDNVCIILKDTSPGKYPSFAETTFNTHS